MVHSTGKVSEDKVFPMAFGGSVHLKDRGVGVTTGSLPVAMTSLK